MCDWFPFEQSAIVLEKKRVQYLQSELSQSWWHWLKADLNPLNQSGLQQRKERRGEKRDDRNPQKSKRTSTRKSKAGDNWHQINRSEGEGWRRQEWEEIRTSSLSRADGRGGEGGQNCTSALIKRDKLGEPRRQKSQRYCASPPRSKWKHQSLVLENKEQTVCD